MLHKYGARLYSRLKMGCVIFPTRRSTFRSSAPNANPNPNLRSSLPGAGPVLPSHLGPQDVHLAHVRGLQSPLEGDHRRNLLVSVGDSPPDLRYEPVACTQNMLDSGASVKKVVVGFISAFCQVGRYFVSHAQTAGHSAPWSRARGVSSCACVCFAFTGHHRTFQTVPST